MEFSILLLVNCGRVPSIQGGIIHSWCEMTQQSSKRHAAVADLGEGPGGPGAPPYFSTKMRPKRNFWRLPPLISGSGWPPLPLIWRSASATLQWISSKLFIFCFRLCVVLFTKQGHQAKEKLVLRLLAKDKMYQRDHRVQFLYLYEDVQKEVIQELNEGLKDDRCTDNSTAAKVNVLFSLSYAGWSWITFTNHD